jgi:hypothetical protein
MLSIYKTLKSISLPCVVLLITAANSVQANTGVTGMSKVTVLDIKVIETSSATDFGGDVAIMFGSAALATLFTKGKSADATMKGAELGLKLGHTIIKSTDGSDDDLMAHLYSPINIGGYKSIQRPNGHYEHLTVGVGSTIVTNKHSISVIDTPHDAKHPNIAVAVLQLVEWDRSSADDDMGTLHIYSYDHMFKKYGPESKNIISSGEIKFVEGAYLRSVILKGPDKSIYNMRYIVEKDAGNCDKMNNIESFMFNHIFKKMCGA